MTALFLGTALSIASVNFVAMIVREMNFTRRTVGQVILASAVIDDSIGWIMVSIIFSLAAAGKIEPWALAESILGTLVFLGLSLTLGRRAVFFAIRFVNDTFKSDFAVITAILVIMGTMSLITYAIGVHTVLGAFVAGVLIGESPILSRHIDDQLRGLVMAFFTPIYFGLAGQSADVTVLANPTIAIYTVGLVAIASLGKFGGAFIGGELGGLTRRESVALACGMNARGSTEVIIATVGLSMGALSSQLFTMIVAMAIITTMAMPPTLRWALARVPMRKEEKQRLEREEMEAKGFVPKLERLLLAIDDSANGQFATPHRRHRRRRQRHADHGDAHSRQEAAEQDRGRPGQGKGQGDGRDGAGRRRPQRQFQTRGGKDRDQDRRHHHGREGAEDRSDRRRGGERLRSDDRRPRQDGGQQDRIHRRHHQSRRRLRGAARGGRGARRPARRSAAQPPLHPRAGQRHRRLAPRRRDRASPSRAPPRRR